MNKKIGIVFGILIIIGLILFVSAETWAGEAFLNLDEGWNLVYGLFDVNQIQGLDTTHIKAIYGFVPTTQEYVRLYPEPDAEDLAILQGLEGEPFDFEEDFAQTAFWVYSDISTEWNTKEFWLYDEIKPIEERSLFKGWNFVGLTPDIIEQPGDVDEPTLLDIQGNCDIEKAYLWLNGEWYDFDEIGRDVAELESNLLLKGMVIKVSDDCTLNSAGSSSGGITPPPIPSP